MPAYTVTMDVDGEVVVETINGVKDAQEAIKKAKDKHPTLIIGVAPFEVQVSFDDEPRPEDHPGQTAIDDRQDKVLEMPTARDEDHPEGEIDLDPLGTHQDGVMGGGLPEAPNPFEDDVPPTPTTEEEMAALPVLDMEAAEAELAQMAGEDDDFGLGS